MKKVFATLFVALLCTGAFACTSVIMTGKVTKDGRPLMWKNTDGGDHYVSQRFAYHGRCLHFSAHLNLKILLHHYIYDLYYFSI